MQPTRLDCGVCGGSVRVRYPLYRDDTVHLECEVREDLGVLVHLDVMEWSSSNYKRMLSIWADILNRFKEEDVKYTYCLVDINDDKHLHFTSMFGFSPITTITTTKDEQFFVCECPT